MANKLMLTLLGLEVFFLLSGGLLLGFAVLGEDSRRSAPATDSVALHLLLKRTPLTATIVNAVCIFATFALLLPAIMLPAKRAWMRFHGYMVAFCGAFTLVIGLTLWFKSLQTRSRLRSVWTAEAPATQSLLQQEFQCCGYDSPTSPPFVIDTTCADVVVAAGLGGCISPLSSFANEFLHAISSTAFGLVGLDTLLLLYIAMVLKQRSEQARYGRIDEKNGIQI